MLAAAAAPQLLRGVQLPLFSGLNSTLPLYAFIDELVCHSVPCILMRLLLLCLVAELTRPELQLGNDMRILAGYDGNSLRIEHVRY